MQALVQSYLVHFFAYKVAFAGPIFVFIMAPVVAGIARFLQRLIYIPVPKQEGSLRQLSYLSWIMLFLLVVFSGEEVPLALDFWNTSPTLVTICEFWDTSPL